MQQNDQHRLVSSSAQPLSERLMLLSCYALCGEINLRAPNRKAALPTLKQAYADTSINNHLNGLSVDYPDSGAVPVAQTLSRCFGSMSGQQTGDCSNNSCSRSGYS